MTGSSLNLSGLVESWLSVSRKRNMKKTDDNPKASWIETGNELLLFEDKMATLIKSSK